MHSLSNYKKLIMNKRVTIFCILSVLSAYICASAAAPEGYYDDAVGKSGSSLQSTLADIINHTDPGYDNLWSIYETTDRRDDGKVWDMYSNTTDFTFGSDQCGNYGREGDCYNREHSIPKSWRGGSKYSDAHMVVPTDGYVNNRRSSYPFGEVGSSSYVSDNSFSKVGTCKTSGYSGTVFEPNDEYKGDFARIYFYAATRYYSECGSWSGDGFSGSFPHLDEWTRVMMLRWHELDPVSQKEIDRNDAVYDSRQGNRNPFVDYPELVDLIFGSETSTPFNPGNITPEEFAAVKATEITDTSFRANWMKHSKATDYELSVWSIVGGEGVEQTLFDVSFADGKPAGWSTVGYTNAENGALRLASGSNDGTVVSPALDLSVASTLTVTCAPYKTSDNSVLYVLVDGIEVAQIDCSASEVTESITLAAATGASSISLKAMESHRVYLKSAKLVTGGGAQKVMVEGYPMRVGNVSSHLVEGLDADTEYYYSVTAYAGNDKLAESNIETVVTGTSSVETTIENSLPGVYIYAYNKAIYIDDAPCNAQVYCYALDGSLVAARTTHTEREVLPLNREGIYIVQIVTQQGSFASRVAVY